MRGIILVLLLLVAGCQENKEEKFRKELYHRYSQLKKEVRVEMEKEWPFCIEKFSPHECLKRFIIKCEVELKGEADKICRDLANKEKVFDCDKPYVLKLEKELVRECREGALSYFNRDYHKGGRGDY